jgi:hypothetical protein
VRKSSDLLGVGLAVGNGILQYAVVSGLLGGITPGETHHDQTSHSLGAL